MALGILDSHIQKNESRPHFIHYTKINSNWIKDLNTRPEAIKLLGENTGGKFLDIILGNHVLDVTLKTKAAKANINT